MIFDLLIPLTVFTFSSSVTPGPNNIMVMTSGLNHGVKKTIPHLLGIGFGFPAMVAAIGLGLSAVFIQFPVIHLVIKVIGIAYLLYLAWKIATTISDSSEEKGQPMTFMQAALFQWVNPKAWVMGIGAVATFTTLDGNVYLEVGIITASFFIVSFPSVGSWLIFGALLQKMIKNRRHQKAFNITMAMFLVLSIIPMITSELS